MSNNTEWMREYAKFQGSVQQRVAADIVEHGEPHEDREHTFSDVKRAAVEMAALAFELYVQASQIESTVALAYMLANEEMPHE